MDAPASKPREDAPASGPSPEVQEPGQISPETIAFLRSSAIGSALLGAVLGVRQEPFPADDEQIESDKRKAYIFERWGPLLERLAK